MKFEKKNYLHRDHSDNLIHQDGKTISPDTVSGNDTHNSETGEFDSLDKLSNEELDEKFDAAEKIQKEIENPSYNPKNFYNIFFGIKDAQNIEEDPEPEPEPVKYYDADEGDVLNNSSINPNQEFNPETDYDYEVEEESKLRQYQTTLSFNSKNNAYDKNIWEPTFRKVMEKTLLPIFFYDRENSSERPVLIKSNSYADITLGIDYQFGLRTKGKNFQIEKKWQTTDVKTVTDGLGDEKFYENPNITLNLWKTTKDEPNTFSKHSFLDDRKKNISYTYIVPHSRKRLREINPNRPDEAEIDEAKMMLYSKKPLKKFFNERIATSKVYQLLTEAYMNNDMSQFLDEYGKPKYRGIKKVGNNSYRIIMNIPGENFNGELHFREDADGHKEIRMYLKDSDLKTIKELKAIRKTVKLK